MIGTLLGGRYEIIEQVGGGGMALVYKAKCTLLNRFVAIKVLKDEFVGDEDFVEKFRRESQAAASLSHPNIVNIYDVGTDEDNGKIIHYIVMEYIEGPTLKELINKKGKLSPEETVDYSTQIANALKAAHSKKIVHRDIKPQNIMLDENDRIKVMDFGIARAATSSTITTTSEALGSVHYFSPEQARGGYTDEKSDIYSLGIVMYEMITGKLPYKGESPITVALKHVQEDIVPPSEIDASVPKDIEKVILKCVQKRQVDRYLNSDEVLVDLNKLARKYNVEHREREIESFDDTSSHTRVMPAVSPEMEEMKKPVKKKRKKPDEQQKKKNSGGFKVVFLGILMAFIVTSAMFFGKDKIGKLFAKEEINMPNLVGMTEEKARKKLEDLGLELASVDIVEDSSVDPGIVLEQDVLADTKLKPGFPVNLTISGTSGDVTIPRLVGTSVLEAERILLKLGIGIGNIERVSSSSVPVDQIMEQSIAEGTEVKKGERINLVVSKGVDQERVRVPSLTGLSISEAKSHISNAGLSVGNIEEKESDHPKGVVIWQSYKTDTNVDKGTSINLQVSMGPAEVPQEEEEEKKPEEPEEQKEEPQKQDVSATFTINGGEGTAVTIIRTQNGEQKTLVNNEQVVGETTMTVTGVEGAKFELYYDGALVETVNR